MKPALSFLIVAGLLCGSGLAVASPQDDHGHGDDKHWDDHDHDHGHNPKDEGRHDNGKHKGWYKKGDRLPDQYYAREYYVTDYSRYHLRRPDPGYRWVRADGGQFYLTLISSGVVIDISAGL
jgi:Ni/Co efflux regulator RcnB